MVEKTTFLLTILWVPASNNLFELNFDILIVNNYHGFPIIVWVANVAQIISRHYNVLIKGNCSMHYDLFLRTLDLTHLLF